MVIIPHGISKPLEPLFGSTKRIAIHLKCCLKNLRKVRPVLKAFEGGSRKTLRAIKKQVGLVSIVMSCNSLTGSAMSLVAYMVIIVIKGLSG